MLIFAAIVLTGCQSRDERNAFDGQFFRAKLATVDGDRAQIAVTVKPVSASLAGALEAGRYEATRHCVLNFGSSVIDWTIGPDQELETYVIEADTLRLRGACQG